MEQEPVKDDGRTIADMNIPGMPWYAGPDDRQGSYGQKKSSSSFQDGGERIDLTKGEKRAIYRGVMAAILPLVLTFGIGYFLIFLFIDLVWLR